MSEPGSTRLASSDSAARQAGARPRLWVVVASIALLEAASAVLDFYFGDTIIPVTYLYVLPVLLAALYLGYAGGIGVPVISAVIFHIEQRLLRQRGPYEEADILFLLMLGIVGVMTARIQAGRRRAREYSRQLERLAQAREELSALIVHDLRTPLAGLLMVLRLLSTQDRSLLPDEHRQLVDVAVTTGEDMSGIIGDLLNLHAMESGALHSHKATADVRDLVQSAVRHVEPLARQRGIEIRTEIADAMPPLVVDEAMIKRVVVNLLANALRFSPDRAAVTLRAERQGAEVIVSVADQGPGIPRQLQDKVFEKFARADEHASRYISTGLGLTFAKMAVSAHGGRIWVESPWDFSGSAASPGSRFSFALSVSANGAP